MPISILGLDITGEDVHETGLIWDTGDGDLSAWPIPGTLVPLLRHAAGARPGADVDVPPRRHADDLRPAPCTGPPARRVWRERGLYPAAPSSWSSSCSRPSATPTAACARRRRARRPRRSGKTEVYSVDHLHGMEPLFADIYAGAAAQGMPVETLISEYAPGQYELTLNYRNDALRAADDLVMLKRLVRAQARRHGVTAWFMAKPIENYAGSGMHFHVSLPDAEGRNVFAENTAGAWAPALLNASAGWPRPWPRSMLVFAPHANSWRRFVAQSYAPLAADLGRQQPFGGAARPGRRRRRTGASSIGRPASTPTPIWSPQRCLPASSKASTTRLDPGPETTGNGYEARQSTRTTMPADWRAAIEAARASAFLKAALGEDLHRTFMAIKQAEYLRVARTVSELDYHLYLHEV